MIKSLPARIAVVDDEPMFHKILTQILEIEGYETTCFCNAKSLIDAAADSNFSLIISDLRMPGMDGMEMLQALNEMSSQIPVVFCYCARRC
jgi:two-component system nitrogen regulation response regulator GlnG